MYDLRAVRFSCLIVTLHNMLAQSAVKRANQNNKEFQKKLGQ